MALPSVADDIGFDLAEWEDRAVLCEYLDNGEFGRRAAKPHPHAAWRVGMACPECSRTFLRYLCDDCKDLALTADDDFGARCDNCDEFVYPFRRFIIAIASLR